MKRSKMNKETLQFVTYCFHVGSFPYSWQNWN